MFVSDFNSKLEAFECAKKTISGPMLKSIQSHLNLTYLNNDEHTHLNKRTGNTDILDMAFISTNLTKHDMPFLTGDDLGSDHLPIQISIDAQPHRNMHTNPIRYKFNQTDREVFESTLKVALSPGDVLELKVTPWLPEMRQESWTANQQSSKTIYSYSFAIWAMQFLSKPCYST